MKQTLPRFDECRLKEIRRGRREGEISQLHGSYQERERERERDRDRDRQTDSQRQRHTE